MGHPCLRIFSKAIFKKSGWLTLCISLIASSLYSNSTDSLWRMGAGKASSLSLDQLLNKADQLPTAALDEHLTYLYRAKELATESGNDHNLFIVYRRIGKCYQQHEIWEEALTAYEQALLIHMSLLKDPAKLLAIYDELAIAQLHTGQFNKARSVFQKGLVLANKLRNTNAIVRAYLGLGRLYQQVGISDKALHHFLMALNLAKRNDQTAQIAEAARWLAIAYAQQSNRQAALQNIQLAVKASEQLQDTLGMAAAALGFGKVYQLLNDQSLAIEQFKHSAELLASRPERPDFVRANMALATLNLQADQSAKAIQIFKQLIDYQQFINKKELSAIYHHLGNAHFMRSHWRTAEKNYSESLRICKKRSFMESYYKNLMALSSLYKKRGAYHKALLYLEEAEKLKVPINQMNKKRRVNQFELKYNMEKGEKDVRELELQQNKIFLLGLASLCGVIFLFMFFIAGLRGRSSKMLKKKNDEIRHHHLKLKETNELLRKFAFVTAHDLKEPLRSIGGFINLLQKRYGNQFNEEAQEYMGFVTSGAIRMNNLLEDLLEYSRISTEAPGNEQVAIKEVLEEVLGNLQGQIQKTEARVNFPKQMPSIHINRLHLTQLFQNLISNALKFAHQRPLIYIAAHRQDERVTISVGDNGIGIDPSSGDKIFNLFHQLNKNHYEGTGIGLSIVKNIVDKYNGEIWFESEKDRGTTFYITILSKPYQISEAAVWQSMSN